MEKEKLTISAKSLMICELINAIIDLFLNTFLVAYLLNITYIVIFNKTTKR